MSIEPEAPYIHAASRDFYERVTPSMLIDYVRGARGAPLFGMGGKYDGLNLTERGKKASNAVFDTLVQLRSAQTILEKRFRPEDARGYDVPVMHYGLALSDREVLQWAELAEIELPLGTTDPEARERRRHTASYLERTRSRLLKHLQEYPGAPASLEWPACFTSRERPRVLSLYTNYDHEATKDFECAILEELRRIEGWDSARNFKWYWDLTHCGMRYIAPWREYNIWPDAEDLSGVKTIYFSGNKCASWSYKVAEATSIKRGRLPSRVGQTLKPAKNGALDKSSIY
ncbi:unnamed protein product [Peniophora sp. CBMAI 1063]|nr:unnamed protein product [Peniophora sp. CBMAI 1063]